MDELNKLNKLDILISFNEVPIESEYIFGSCQKLKKFTTIDQMLALMKSIKKNWPNFSGKIIALHSEKLSGETKVNLESVGFTIVQMDCEETFVNRSTCFTYQNSSEFSLILDTDMLFLKKPLFDYSKDICMGYGGSFPKENRGKWKEMWDRFCKEVGLLNNYNDEAFKIYHTEGKEVYFPQRNNGCLLIRTSMKKEFLKSYLDIWNKIKQIPVGFSHFKGQCAVGLAYSLMENRGNLPVGVNFIGSQLPLDEKVILFHYVGANKGLTDELVKEYFL